MDSNATTTSKVIEVENLNTFYGNRQILRDVTLSVEEGEILVIGWGGTKGSITAAVEALRDEGLNVSQTHLRHLHPFPANLGEVLSRFKKVLLPELSDGHLALLLRAKFLIDIQRLTKIEGQPFKIAELTDAIRRLHAS